MEQQLPYRLDRTVTIHAAPATVFRYFTDSDRFARWWGAGSTIDARPGGRVFIRHPGGVETVGEVLEVTAPERIVFTYGFASGKPIRPGSSRVTIRLEPALAGGTRLFLVHEFPEASVCDEHVQGWRFQLSVFANVVADEVFAGAAGTVDAWFAAWAVADEPARTAAFQAIAEEGVVFRDRYSLLEGIADLTAHAGAAQRFMPGITMKRKGGVRQCQGVVLADWAATSADGVERMTGTNVFLLGLDGRVASATGLANPMN
jgi:uncharacterized protein YndB with AHSA1/START domain